MNENNTSNPKPFQHLGKKLQHARERRRESLAEAAGAVEIEEGALERIEAGAERPSEDILMLLIDHLDVQDHEAVQLWESAGYEREESRRRSYEPADKATLVVLAMDMRTLYTDKLTIDAKPTGLVLNFLQEGPNQQPIPAARVGMSYEQAEEVVRVLQHSILYGKYQGPKRLGS
jgi:transcriptional regulator with XRE-family HTH domain